MRSSLISSAILALVVSCSCHGFTNSTSSGADASPPPPAHPPIGLAVGGGHSEGGEIVGQLQVSPALVDRVQPSDVIFIMARNAATGTLVAATKMNAPRQFPLAFVLGPQNVMVPGGLLEGPVKLSARIDKDGSASSKNAGDLVAEFDGPLAVPCRDITLMFNRVL